MQFTNFELYKGFKYFAILVSIGYTKNRVEETDIPVGYFSKNLNDCALHICEKSVKSSSIILFSQLCGLQLQAQHWNSFVCIIQFYPRPLFLSR
jgi:hypothetical protein